MSYENYKLRYRLTTIYILIDALESELTALNPIKHINNVEASNELESLKHRITRVRKYLDSGLKHYKEAWGDCSDVITEIIENKIKEIEIAELASKNLK